MRSARPSTSLAKRTKLLDKLNRSKKSLGFLRDHQSTEFFKAVRPPLASGTIRGHIHEQLRLFKWTGGSSCMPTHYVNPLCVGSIYQRLLFFRVEAVDDNPLRFKRYRLFQCLAPTFHFTAAVDNLKVPTDRFGSFGQPIGDPFDASVKRIGQDTNNIFGGLSFRPCGRTVPFISTRSRLLRICFCFCNDIIFGTDRETRKNEYDETDCGEPNAVFPARKQDADA